MNRTAPPGPQAAPLAAEAAIDPAQDLIAYFCAEYAVDDLLPIYAGGLGVLAGDHLKTAADLGLPLVAVGLLYLHGYFVQTIDARGQHAHAVSFDPAAAGLTVVPDALGRELRVGVQMAEHEVHLRVWRKDVGRVPLFLLDANVPENAAEDRAITARLYDAVADRRLQQEIVLGIGGVRALRAMGLRPTVWHMNEGHAAFVVLERVRKRVALGQRFEAALESVAAATVFTTHTAVPAGHDVFRRGHLHQWLHSFLGALHTTENRLMALGLSGARGEGFSMTALALRGSRFRNGVSKVHRDVAARMESYVWPQVPPAESPMQHVTNGVHLPTFLAQPWQTLLDQELPNWRRRVLTPADLGFVDRLGDDELARLRQQLRLEMLDELRERIGRMHSRLGTPANQLEAIAAGLDRAAQGAVIIGFARRFATYKRAALLLRDADRLARLLNDPQRPALLLFAGKAHPHDLPGQELIRRLFAQSLQPEFLGRLLVIEGYDLQFARALVRGSDIWLNTPEYPLEASGTSGMKAGANGVVNLSIPDGWWAEGYDGANGYSLEPSAAVNPEQRDDEDARRLFELLEQRVLPEYYGPQHQPPSAEWLQRVRASVRTIVPGFGSARMLDDYRRIYARAAGQGRRLEADDGRAAVNFARWKRLVLGHWGELQLWAEPGAPLRVVLRTGTLPPECITVQGIGADGQVMALQLDGALRAEARYSAPAGAPPVRHVRAFPGHPLLAHPLEMGLLAQIDIPP